MKISQKTDKVLKKILGTYIVLQVLFVAGFAAHPPIGAIAMTLVGRGPECGITESIRSFYRRWRTPLYQQAAVRRSKPLRKEGGYQLLDTPYGQIWEPDIVGSAILAQIGEIEGKYAGFEGTPIRKGDIVLDGGANIGVTVMYALSLGAAKVVAIEPSPRNVEVLNRNFSKQIAEGRVIVYPKGVWDKDDVLKMNVNDDTSAMDSVVLKRNSNRTVDIPLTTIDKLVEELKLERVDFIKLDTEGADKQAMRGARQTIARYRPRFEISVDHLPGDPIAVPALLKSMDPSYKTRCLVCDADWNVWRMHSTILYFD